MLLNLLLNFDCGGLDDTLLSLLLNIDCGDFHLFVDLCVGLTRWLVFEAEHRTKDETDQCHEGQVVTEKGSLLLFRFCSGFDTTGGQGGLAARLIIQILNLDSKVFLL